MPLQMFGFCWFEIPRRISFVQICSFRPLLHCLCCKWVESRLAESRKVASHCIKKHTSAWMLWYRCGSEGANQNTPTCTLEMTECWSSSTGNRWSLVSGSWKMLIRHLQLNCYTYRIKENGKMSTHLCSDECALVKILLLLSVATWW